ncbi:MAG: AtpZ/AtpI family protein [Chloroflexi bacterium]|nr:AtpZ/AtpI family protein [Chloroflexota bacterium]
MAQSNEERKNIINTVLIVMVGQVGCLTLIIVLASLFGGLWLDRTFNTKPLFTLILLFAGIPLSVILMLVIARRTIARLKSKPDTEEKKDLSA